MCMNFLKLFSGCVFGTRDFRQITIIARTNLGLFEEMARVLRSQGGDKKKLGFVGVRLAATLFLFYDYIMNFDASLTLE